MMNVTLSTLLARYTAFISCPIPKTGYLWLGELGVAKTYGDVLCMCSINAMKSNTACKALYDRLRVNGKTGFDSSV